MASDELGLWNNLPSIIIVQIFSLLSVKDRFSASAVCRGWREILFHPSLWQKVVFRVNSCDNAQGANEETRFLKNHCARFVRNAVVEINSLNPLDVLCGKEILDVLSNKHNLRALTLRPRSCRLEWLDSNEEYIDQYMKALLDIIKKSNRLEHLSLGCIEEILDFTDILLVALGKYQGKSISSLHLSSVKEYPETYFILDVPANLFEPFCNLEALSIDFDYLSNKLLLVLSEPYKKPLCRLNIHVHGIDPDKPRIDSEVWQKIRDHSPNLEVTVTLLHCQDTPNNVSTILNKNMPLTHFRSYFSSCLDDNFLTLLAFLNNLTLQSLTMVESISEHELYTASFLYSTVDPLVMLAWRCKKLSHLTVIGYEVSGANLIAIARLRGTELKELKVPSCCLSLDEADEVGITAEQLNESVTKEVSSSLGQVWRLLNIEDLPPSACDINMDADGTYLEQLLGDQKW